MNTPVQPELTLIADFLGECLPFDTLGDDERLACARMIDIRYIPAGTVLSASEHGRGLHILRSGAVDIRGEGTLYERVEDGESVRLPLVGAEEDDAFAVTVEDTLSYCLPESAYLRLRREQRHIDRFFQGQRSRRLRRAARLNADPGVLRRPVSEVMSRDLLIVAPDTPVVDVAQQMTARRVSSALVASGDRLDGVLTDRDLRTRVIAAARDNATAVRECMTPRPLVVQSTDRLFDVVLLMTEHNIHHVPVVDGDDLVGIVTTSDISMVREDDPIYFVSRINRQQDIEGLTALARQVPTLLIHWDQAQLPPSQQTRLLTAISDAITARLVALAQVTLGPAPATFSWLAFGSQARGEQLLGGDQDNGLLISDSVDEAGMRWFESMAAFVCDGLNACGYDYCPGDVMASAAEWRHTFSQWTSIVDGWMEKPTPDAMMRVSIFFDFRCVVGEQTMSDSLRRHVLAHTRRNTIFQAALAANVLDNPPPLGLFRRFVVERDGEHRHELDLKKRGILPVVEIVRLHALANGIDAVSTEERLRALADSGALHLSDSRNLLDAYHVFMRLRLQRQARQVSAGEATDNFFDPASLTKMARRELRDAFAVIADALAAVRQRYRQGVE